MSAKNMTSLDINVVRRVPGLLRRESEKRNHFSFTNKSFNTQRNVDKFSVLLLLMNITVDATCLISGIYTNFRRLLRKKCDVGYLRH